MSDDFVKNTLFLKQLDGIGNATIHKKYAKYLDGEFETLVNTIKQTEPILQDAEIEEAQIKAEALVKRYIAGEFDIITYHDMEYYPKSFLELGNKKPLLLFIKGNKSLLRRSAVAVIGTREPSEITWNEGASYIKKIADVRKGEVIVSGLALGCDEIAHVTALKNSLPTVAILPSGFDAIAPKQHTKLAKEIVDKGGCLISEYMPAEDAKNYTYIARDKLVAALSERILVLECGIHSGTMHTVEAGKKLKRILGVLTDKFDGNRIIHEAGGYDITTPKGFKKFVEEQSPTNEENTANKGKQTTLGNF